MTRVWVVEYQEYDAGCTAGVFSSEEKAAEFIAAQTGAYRKCLEVIEWEVDSTTGDPAKRAT